MHIVCGFDILRDVLRQANLYYFNIYIRGIMVCGIVDPHLPSLALFVAYIRQEIMCGLELKPLVYQSPSHK